MKHMTLALILFVFGIQLASAQRWCNGPGCDDRNPQPKPPTRGWCGPMDCETRTQPRVKPIQGSIEIANTRFVLTIGQDINEEGIAKKTTNDFYELYTDNQVLLGKLFVRTPTEALLSMESGENYKLSFLKKAPQRTQRTQRVCPTDTKLCSYYTCYRRWPPADCQVDKK